MYTVLTKCIRHPIIYLSYNKLSFPYSGYRIVTGSSKAYISFLIRWCSTDQCYIAFYSILLYHFRKLMEKYRNIGLDLDLYD